MAVTFLLTGTANGLLLLTTNQRLETARATSPRPSPPEAEREKNGAADGSGVQRAEFRFKELCRSRFDGRGFDFELVGAAEEPPPFHARFPQFEQHGLARDTLRDRSGRPQGGSVVVRDFFCLERRLRRCASEKIAGENNFLFERAIGAADAKRKRLHRLRCLAFRRVLLGRSFFELCLGFFEGLRRLFHEAKINRAVAVDDPQFSKVLFDLDRREEIRDAEGFGGLRRRLGPAKSLRDRNRQRVRGSEPIEGPRRAGKPAAVRGRLLWNEAALTKLTR